MPPSRQPSGEEGEFVPVPRPAPTSAAPAAPVVAPRPPPEVQQLAPFVPPAGMYAVPAMPPAMTPPEVQSYLPDVVSADAMYRPPSPLYAPPEAYSPFNVTAAMTPLYASLPPSQHNSVPPSPKKAPKP